MKDIVDMKESGEIVSFGEQLGFDSIEFGLKGKVVTESDELKIRNKVDNGTFDLLLNPHLVSRKDHMHFRRGGMNQVICGILHRKKIAVGFSLDKLVDPVHIGRVKQDIKLCRKYKVVVKVFSLAKNKFEMRGADDLLSFLKSLGMTGAEAKRALS
jgi:RNase P/RNase MRP subunit p30